MTALRKFALSLTALLVFATAASSLTPTQFLKTVTTAGTPVVLSSSTLPATWVTIQALSSNTGTICVGGLSVSASSRKGTCLAASQAAPFYAVANNGYDLSLIWIDSTVNGEGVAVTYAQ